MDTEKFLNITNKMYINPLDADRAVDLFPMLEQIQKRLEYTDDEVLAMLNKCPEMLNANPYVLAVNFSDYSTCFDLRSFEIRALLFKYPKLLLENIEFIYSKIKLISTLFGCSIKISLKLLYLYPFLIDLNKEDIKSKIKQLSTVLFEFGLGLRKILRNEPNLLFIDLKEIDKKKKYFMKNFGFSEPAVLNMFKAVPSLLLESYENLVSRFNKYYPIYFIKRDLVEIIEVCPEFSILEPNCVLSKIEEISQIFNISIKKACEFVRKAPNILFYDSAKIKILGFSNLKISLKFVNLFPRICNEPEISLPIKFLLARILNLDSEFDKVCDTETSLFISRFLFMQSHNIYNHSDLMIDEISFTNKYGLDSERLKQTYKASQENLKNVCEFYVKLKDELPNWNDILFPNFEDVLSFINSEETLLQKTQEYDAFEYFTNTQKILIEEFRKLSLSMAEIKLIFAKNKAIALFSAKEIKELIFVFKKYGLSHENIIRLLINKPSMFLTPLQSLEELILEIIEYEKSNEQKAIINYL